MGSAIVNLDTLHSPMFFRVVSSCLRELIWQQLQINNIIQVHNNYVGLTILCKVFLAFSMNM